MVFLNGRFVPEEDAVVSVFDRGFRYGDALFEAVLVRHGKMFRWAQHAARLARGATALRLPWPEPVERLEALAGELIARNQMPDAALRLQLSRGIGPRGYAPTGEEQPSLVMSLHPAPVRPLTAARWKLTVSSWRVAAHDRLAQHKTCCRLLQVMAALEARERGADESLVLDTDGHVTEGGTSNVFWIENGRVFTTPLDAGILPGVTRAAIQEICAARGIPQAERLIRPEELLSCEGVFVTFTTRGLVEAEALDGKPLRLSPLTARLRSELEGMIERECAPA